MNILQDKMKPFWEQYHRVIKVVLSGGLALFLGLSLFSYNPYDPSFNRAADLPVHNMMGRLGAYIADPILQLFGVGAYTLVVMFGVWCIRLLFKQRVSYSPVRGVFAVAMTLVVCIVLGTMQASETWPFYVGYGGYAGDKAYAFMAHYLSLPLLLTAAVLVSIPLVVVTMDMRRSEIAWCVMVTQMAVGYVVLTVKQVALLLWSFVRRKSETTVTTAEEKAVSVIPTKKEVREKFSSFKEKAEPKRKKRVKQTVANENEKDGYLFPGFHLLTEKPNTVVQTQSQAFLRQQAARLQKVLEDFGINGKIVNVRPGPVVTLYELEPAPGTKSSRVIGLADDIARSVSAISARIAVVPGRNVLGIELPNDTRETVYLHELLDTKEFNDPAIALPIALGHDIGGSMVMTDLARMPHLLIAGTTGSGKSVAVNAMILSFLYRLSPEECKFIMIDPKMLELSVYEGIPHLLSPVVTEPSKAVVALKWAVKEMESRYRSMSNLGVRNIAGYNKRIEEAIQKGETLERTVQTGFNPETGEPIYEKVTLEMKKLPFIVVIVDEMADLMLTAGKDIEGSIQRLAQMARAAGIHMVMATQRPSVDVITGVIKANFPTRISFQVTSRIDSRTILGEMGAEQLLGKGDMLYMAGGGRITRVHGPFVDDGEVEEVVGFLKSQGEPEYLADVTKEDESSVSGDGAGSDSGDELYDKAVAVVLRDKRASTSYVQRQLKIGYNRAANLIERMEEEGVISGPNHAGKREVLAA